MKAERIYVQPVGNSIVNLQKVDSTNNFAKKLLAKNCPLHGTVVSATEQHSGKGQNGSKWCSDVDKNVILSIILQPRDAHPDDLFFLNKAIAIAIAKTVKAILPTSEVNIKWPNDLYVSGKKISGMLVENALSTSGVVKNVIVGIGLNVNQTDFPAGLNATSLSLEKDGAELKVDKVKALLYRHANHWYQMFVDKQYQMIEDAYHNHLMGLGEARKFWDANEQAMINGTIKKVALNGQLMVEVNGGVKRYNIKEISFI